MIRRLLLVVAGLAIGAWALVGIADVGACQDAGRSVFVVGSEAEADRAVERVGAECRGTAVLIATASVLNADHPTAARRIVDEAVAREPESAAAWATLRRVALAARDITGVLRASERLRALDPRSRVGR